MVMAETSGGYLTCASCGAPLTLRTGFVVRDGVSLCPSCAHPKKHPVGAGDHEKQVRGAKSRWRGWGGPGPPPERLGVKKAVRMGNR